MDEEIQLIDVVAIEFARDLNRLLQAYPHYRLDGGWLSIGVIDSLLSPLRGKKKFTSNDEQILFVAASYLAQIVVKGWKSFNGHPSVGVFARQKPRPTIRITLRSGAGLDGGQEQTIELFESLKSLLLRDYANFPVYREFSLIAYRNSNILSPFIAGVVSGASPAAQGPLSRLTAKQQVENEEPVAAFISSKISEEMQRRYPLKEAWGEQLLYHLCASLPPDYDDGPALLRHTVPAWAEASQRYPDNLEREQMFEEWAKSNDDLLAKVGCALRFASCQIVPSGLCRTLVEAQGLRASRFRHAVHACRLQQEFEGSWSELLKGGHLELAQHYFCIDSQLGLMPLVAYPVVSQLHMMEYEPLLNMVAAGVDVPSDGIQNLYQLLDPKVIEFQLQFTKLFLLKGELDAAKEILVSLRAQIAQSDRADLRFCYGALMADLAKQEGEIDTAIQIFSETLQIPTEDTKGKTEATAELLALLLASKRVDDLLDVANQALDDLPDAMAPHMFMAGVFIAQDQLHEAENHCKWLYRRVPNHPEIFQLIRSLQLAMQTAPL